MNKEEKELHNALRAVVRRAWSRYKYKFKAKASATTKKKVGTFKNGKPKYLNYCTCAICNLEFKAGDVEVDHIRPAGAFNSREGFKEWSARILYDVKDNLQILCKETCHPAKTYSETYNVTFEEALRRKVVIAFLSTTAAKQKATLKKLGYSGAAVSNEEKRELLFRELNNL
jgi:hypothetical protein